MRIRAGGAVLFLGRFRKDGWRCVYAVRFLDWNPVMRLLRKSKIKARLHGDRLFVWTGHPDQLHFAFLDSNASEEARPCA